MLVINRTNHNLAILIHNHNLLVRHGKELAGIVARFLVMRLLRSLEERYFNFFLIQALQKLLLLLEIVHFDATWGVSGDGRLMSRLSRQGARRQIIQDHLRVHIHRFYVVKILPNARLNHG